MKKTLSRSVLCGLALAHLTCNQAILTAPPGAVMFLSVNPGFIPAHGGVSVISALVLEEPGTPVPDGTVVQFFTTLGRIEEQGRTNDGVARVNLVSDSRSGPAEVAAISGPASAGPVTVLIGAILPARVILTANPSRIPANSRSTHIFATVLDGNGNPVPNIPVVFQVVPPATGPVTEFMDSGGTPLFTDNNGRAEDVLRTQRLFGTPGSAVVQVTVLSAGVQTQTLTVPIE